MLTNLSLKTYSAITTSHAHDFLQWVFPLKGELLLHVGGEQDNVTTEQSVFIPTGEIHKFHSEIDNLFLVMDFLDARSMNTLSLPTFWKLNNTFRHLQRFILSYIDEFQLISHKLQNINLLLNDLLRQQFSLQLDQRVNKVLEFLTTNIEENITLKNVADHCFLSVSQLQRRFKKAMGTSIMQYFCQLRFKRAAMLLKQSDLSIHQIALQCGYSDQTAFTRQFHKMFNQTPSEYRSLHLLAN